MRDFDKEGLWSDLRHRTQAEKEKISPYIFSLRHIVRHLRYPLNDRYLAMLAYHNLHSTYREALTNRVPMSPDEWESWSLPFGKLRKLNYRWSVPPTAEKMHIPYAALKEQASQNKTIAATSVSGEVAVAT